MCGFRLSKTFVSEFFIGTVIGSTGADTGMIKFLDLPPTIWRTLYKFGQNFPYQSLTG